MQNSTHQFLPYLILFTCFTSLNFAHAGRMTDLGVLDHPGLVAFEKKTKALKWHFGMSASSTFERQDLTVWGWGLHLGHKFGSNKRIPWISEFSYLHGVPITIDGYRLIPIEDYSLQVGPHLTLKKNITCDFRWGIHMTIRHYLWNRNLYETLNNFTMQLGYKFKINNSHAIGCSIFFTHTYANKHWTDFLGLKTQYSFF